MELYILRHGIAVERGTEGAKNDFDRPLTKEGEQKVRRITKALRNLEFSFDLILSSPYVRARETAEIVAAGFALQKRLELRDSLGADRAPQDFLAELIKGEPLPQSLLLVGHEPFLSGLASLIISGTTRPCLILKKAGLCKLEADKLRNGRCAKLVCLLTPKQLLQMA